MSGKGDLNIKERYRLIVEWFRENMPQAQSELKFNSPYQLLVAVMLSAQCTDKRVNMTTPALFERYPSIRELAAASEDDVFSVIRSISYPNSKANHLCRMAEMVVSEFGGEIPSERDQLVRLPGVGIKTANVVTSIIYDKPFIAVDTHVFRVAHRTGLSDGRTPVAVEKDLESNIDEELRSRAHHWLILHGRYVCTARNPKCDSCGIARYCREHTNAKNLP
ncbi:MAG: endonuclease III [Bacteroidales bacterium]|nr:endonuclease III [Candidatus Cacconaster merdequi]